MIRDNSTLTRQQILEKPGYISAKIVFNTLYDNNFNIFFIGNTTGNSLYTVQLNNNERALVGFTDENLLKSYVNRDNISKMLRNMFGSKIICVNMNICSLYKLLYSEEYNERADDQDLRTIVINPNYKDFFIPLHIQTLYDFIIANDVIDKKYVENYFEDDNLKPLSYDKEHKMYVFQEDDNLIL